MTRLVVDASVAAKWFSNESGFRKARGLMTEAFELSAPEFLLVEMDNVLWQRVRRTDMTDAEAQRARAALRRLPIHYEPDEPLRDTAFQLACEIDHPIYDSMYLALALRSGCRVVTADKRLLRAVAGSRYAGLGLAFAKLEA